MLPRIFACVAMIALAAVLAADEPTKKKSPREALQAFGELIGSWRCTGTPNGTREEIQKNFWTEKMSWEWQFKDKDAWLKIGFEKGKYFTGGEVRYVPEKDHFTLTLTTAAKEKITYIGSIETRDKTKIVTFEREVNKDSQRLVFTLLHDNLYNYKFEEKPDGRPLYKMKWTVRRRQGRRGVRRGDRQARMHRLRRHRHDDGQLHGQNLLRLLLRLPRRIQRQPRQVRQGIRRKASEGEEEVRFPLCRRVRQA